MQRRQRLRTVVEVLEVLIVGVVGLGVGPHDVMSHLVHPDARVVDARGENPDTVAQPRHHEGFVECDPQRHLQCGENIIVVVVVVVVVIVIVVVIIIIAAVLLLPVVVVVVVIVIIIMIIIIIIIIVIIMYSFMCYFSKLQHMASYKAKKRNVVGTLSVVLQCGEDTVSGPAMW